MANASQPPGRTPLSLASPIAASLGTVPAIDAPGRDVPDARESCPRRRAFQVPRRNRRYPANISAQRRTLTGGRSGKIGHKRHSVKHACECAPVLPARRSLMPDLWVGPHAGGESTL